MRERGLDIQEEVDDDDSLVIVDELDLADETELRYVAGTIEELLQVPGYLCLSVLNVSQWQNAIARLVTPARGGAERFLHVISDRADPRHLLVSPSAVRGLNAGDRVIYAEIVYAMLRAIPSALGGPLRRGLDDLFAQKAAGELGIPFFTRNYPQEADVADGVLRVLVNEFGYSLDDWALLLRRDPDRVLFALSKTRFCSQWLTQVKTDRRLAAELVDAPRKRQALIEMLRGERGRLRERLLRVTREALADYRREQKGAEAP